MYLNEKSVSLYDQFITTAFLASLQSTPTIFKSSFIVSLVFQLFCRLLWVCQYTFNFYVYIPLCLFSEDASRLSSSGIPSHDSLLQLL